MADTSPIAAVVGASRHSPAVGGVASPTCHLGLLGGFSMSEHEQPVSVSGSGQRLVAYLALARRPVPRTRVAAELWDRSDEVRAGTNLRTTLWRLPRGGAGIVSRCGSSLALASGLGVDVQEAEALVADPLVRRGAAAAHELVTMQELLPGWGELWVVQERERLSELRLAALTEAAQSRLHCGDAIQALTLATSAVRAEPLRESSWGLVIASHVALGNLADVQRAYAEYAALLRAELGLAPSRVLRGLLAETGVALPRDGAPSARWRAARP
jgi:DNA-binding SARP family transcriptional activator